jgi:hypothetical protein
MSDPSPTRRLLLRRRRTAIALGCLCSALPASILAVPVPYYAIFAVVAAMRQWWLLPTVSPTWPKVTE